ncbi:hypothetical protein WJ33_24375 [Burkholderia ubonensis]|uniref:Uncharacterized protein n=1 Tax=Burkholderia ubonensis TaxID=101571 RepID=A0A103RH38_9BURK|nr:hypothetical protein WJ33_24375 [Burkholderia ubonensis]
MRNLSDISVWIRFLYGIVGDAVCSFSASKGFAEGFSDGVAAFRKLTVGQLGLCDICVAIVCVSANLRHFLVGAAGVLVAECNGHFILGSSFVRFAQ